MDLQQQNSCKKTVMLGKTVLVLLDLFYKMLEEEK